MKFESGFTKDELDEMNTAGAEPQPAPEPQPSPEPEPEVEGDEPEPQPQTQQVAPQPGAKRPPPPKGYVEVEALQARDRELKDMKDKFAKVDQWMREQTQQRQAPQQQQQGQQPQIPDFNTDPIGHLHATNQLLQQQLAQMNTYQQQRVQQDQAQAFYQDQMNRYNTHVRTFSRQNPDYAEADAWLRANIDQELAARFPWASPQERQAHLEREEGFLVGSALQQGRDPAEIIYNLAKHRGFKKAEPQAQPQETKLEQLQRGQKAAKSSAGARASSDNDLDITQLLKLDGEDFDRGFEKLKKQYRWAN